jgi:hypothetical protein
VLEAKLLKAQAYLAHQEREKAGRILAQCEQIPIQEAEPRQHFLLTRAWYSLLKGDPDGAYDHLEAASEVFSQRSRAGDHTPHLLGRLSRLVWPAHAHERLDAWMALLNDRSRRLQE